MLTESDDAAIMYTSGTTGKPKGAVLHHRGFILTAMLTADFIQYRPEDKMMCSYTPLSHHGHFSRHVSSIFSGAGAVYIRRNTRRKIFSVYGQGKGNALYGR